jgi:hypothetical protein
MLRTGQKGLLQAADIDVTASPVATAVVLGAVVQQVETKMVPTTTTVAMTNKMHHGAPSTLPSNPHPREGKSKGQANEGEG